MGKRPRSESSEGSSASPQQPAARRRRLRTERSPTPNDGRKQYAWQRGDVLDGRYTVQQLLGEGTFAKVVLCTRSNDGSRCAVKVVHDIHRYRESSKIEASMIRNAQRRDPDGHHGLVTLLDQFDHHGHTCLVFPRYGPSLYQLVCKNDYAPFSEHVLRGIAYHTLRALAFLHNLRMVHTDIKPENVLLKYPQTFRDGAGQHVPVSCEIVLIDFGSVQYDDEYKGRTVQTRNYRAPEVLVTDGEWSMPADVWSVGCMLVELLAGDAMFNTDVDAEHLALMEVVLQTKFRRSAPYMLAVRDAQDFFASDGGVRWPTRATTASELRYLKSAATLRQLCRPLEHGKTGRNAFLDLVQALLRLDPVERATAKEALKMRFVAVHDW